MREILPPPPTICKGRLGVGYWPNVELAGNGGENVITFTDPAWQGLELGLYALADLDGLSAPFCRENIEQVAEIGFGEGHRIKVLALKPRVGLSVPMPRVFQLFLAGGAKSIELPGQLSTRGERPEKGGTANSTVTVDVGEFNQEQWRYALLMMYLTTELSSPPYIHTYQHNQAVYERVDWPQLAYFERAMLEQRTRYIASLPEERRFAYQYTTAYSLEQGQPPSDQADIAVFSTGTDVLNVVFGPNNCHLLMACLAMKYNDLSQTALAHLSADLQSRFDWAPDIEQLKTYVDTYIRVQGEYTDRDALYNRLRLPYLAYCQTADPKLITAWMAAVVKAFPNV